MRTKILIVDDDYELTELLRSIPDADLYDVLIANAGLEGVKLAGLEDPDLLIIDYFLPDVDGLQVCREIRQFSKAPILVISALNKPDMIAKVLDAGADDYLTKPFKSKILMAHLKKLARRSQIGRYTIPNNSQYSA